MSLPLSYQVEIAIGFGCHSIRYPNLRHGKPPLQVVQPKVQLADWPLPDVIILPLRSNRDARTDRTSNFVLSWPKTSDVRAAKALQTFCFVLTFIQIHAARSVLYDGLAGFRSQKLELYERMGGLRTLANGASANLRRLLPGTGSAARVADFIPRETPGAAFP